MSDALKTFKKDVLTIADEWRVYALEKMQEQIRELARKELGDEVYAAEFRDVAIQQFHKRDVVGKSNNHFHAYCRKEARKKTSEGNVSNE